MTEATQHTNTFISIIIQIISKCMHTCMHHQFFLLTFRLLNILRHTSLGICLNLGGGIYIPRGIITSSKDTYIFILVPSAKLAFQNLMQLGLCMKANISLHSSLDTMLSFLFCSTIMIYFLFYNCSGTLKKSRGKV